MEANAEKKHACEVCGCAFASRQGLSSHARLHLRHLGVPLSECTHGPIALLYKLFRESDGSTLDFLMDQREPSGSAAAKDAGSPVPGAAKYVKVAGLKGSPAGSVAGLKRPTPGLPLLLWAESKKSDTQSPSCKPTSPKPLWAPQETDSPVTLASNSNDEVHVCQVCGAWYETRKGLSSHARAHLRQLGVPDANSKISPINLLYQIKNIKPEDLGPVAPQTSPKSFVKHPSLDSPSTSSLETPPSKRAKQTKFICVLCGEEFENRKGLGSHARSHLRQIGVSDLLGKTSAVDAIEELASSGMLADIWPITPKPGKKKKKKPTSKPATTKAPSSAPSSAPSPAPSTAPSTALSPALASPPPPPPPPPQSLSPNSTALSSPGLPLPVNRVPKAKKGFRLAVDPQWKKTKVEPLDKGMPTSIDFTGPTLDGKPIPLILCEYCGQLFDTRKGLSCHVRAHLRQLGIAWTSKSSPIDLLRELMGKEVSGDGTDLSSGKKGNSQTRKKLTIFSVLPLLPSTSLASFCELCGFEFNHRKALASHARAHLRQLGVTEWKSDGTKGSPIEILKEWIQKEPTKAAEITQRYLMGDLFIKKRPPQSPAPPTEADPVAARGPEPLGLLPGPRAGRELLGATGQDNSYGSPQQQQPRPGNIPALLPNPPLTPLVKLVGKVYSLKCRFCDQVFQGPLSVQEDWIAHLQKHILKLGYKGKASPSPAVAMSTQSIIDPAAV
ncbi:unnamed protein product [Merluccius merluccius]